MTSVNLVFRPSAKEGHHQGSLYIRLIHERRSKSLAIRKCHIYSSEWDEQKQNIIYPENDSKRAVYLQGLEAIIRDEFSLLFYYLRRLEKRGRYTVDELAALYRHRKDENKLCGYTESLCYEFEFRAQYRTSRAYRTVTKALIDFNKGRDIPLSQINTRLIKDFENHLKEKGRLPNTISYYMRNLRAIYNKAIACGRIAMHKRENPFTGIYTGVTRTMKRSLSAEDLKKFHSINLAPLIKNYRKGSMEYNYLKKLEAAHLYFCFCFYARGMCFIDLAYLKKENIREGVIRYTRKKTGRQIEMRVTKPMIDIINYFAELTRKSNYVFPILKESLKVREDSKLSRIRYETALRLQNNRLKQLAYVANVNKPISTHWARHTWATIGKNENIPVSVISECLGHTSEKTTQIYLGLLDNSILDAANERISSIIQVI